MTNKLLKIDIKLIEPSPAISPTQEEIDAIDEYNYHQDMGELLSEEERNREDYPDEYHGVKFCE